VANGPIDPASIDDADVPKQVRVEPAEVLCSSRDLRLQVPTAVPAGNDGAHALRLLKRAKQQLESRTARRKRRGTEGKMMK
jgi:hypothetical protein